MTLANTHKEYVLERLYLEYLYDGIIPTSETLTADLATYQKTYLSFEEPTSKFIDFEVEHGGNSNAELIETIKSSVHDDVRILNREIYRVAKETQRFFDRWLMEMGRLEVVASNLDQRVDSLLLLTSDTLGMFASISDGVVDMAKIDTASTTAEVNIRENTIKINPSIKSAKDSSGGSLIDLTSLKESDASFNPLSLRDGTAKFNLNEENSLDKIFKSDNSSWVGKISTSKSGEMIAELKIAASASKDIKVSKISINYDGPNSTERATVSLQYSKDGYTWYLVPTSTATKTLNPKLSWAFPEIDLRWLKFIFYKPAPDNVNNEYIYSISSLKLHGQVYEENAGNTLVTKPLSALNKENKEVAFSKVTLQTCQEVPDNTSINYYLAGSKDNSIWTDWFSVSPYDSTGILYPKIINFGGADWKDNSSEDNTTKLYSSVTEDGLSQKRITTSFDTNFSGYRFKDDSFSVVNTAINITTGEDPDPISNSVLVWRNVRYRDINNYPDTETVRGVPRGWGIIGSNYSCYFEIIDSNGTKIDFGSKECELDGQVVSGVVDIPVGIHKFSTAEDNWFDISNNINNLTGNISSEETLRSIDPLYPYNHKLLIEGIPYISAFMGDKKYKGTDLSAEYYCRKVSLFDLENNEESLGAFAVRSVGDETNPTLAVILRYDANNSDFSNELSFVKWRSGDTNATMYKYVKLKAILSTKDTSVSPILNSYRIKLGL